MKVQVSHPFICIGNAIIRYDGIVILSKISGGVNHSTGQVLQQLILEFKFMTGQIYQLHFPDDKSLTEAFEAVKAVLGDNLGIAG